MSERQQAVSIPAVLAAAAALFAAGYALRHTVSSFLLSFVIAYLLDPFVVFLEKQRIRRGIGIALLYVVLGIIGIFCAAYLVPLLNIRWSSLLTDLPKYIQKGKEIVLNTAGAFQPAYASEEWSWFLDRIAGGMDSVLNRMGAAVYTAVTKVAFNLLNLILAPILVFFMLYYKREIIDGTASWLPPARREGILELGREINSSVGGYIRGQMIVSLIVAALSATALFYLDIDYALLNGLFAGLASILPFIGVIVAMLPPLFFGYVKFQSGMVLLKIAGAFSIIYFLEGYLVKPLVFKKSMDLNPLVTIIAVMAFGELLGFWGILLAIPIAAAAKIVSARLRRGGFLGEV